MKRIGVPEERNCSAASWQRRPATLESTPPLIPSTNDPEVAARAYSTRNFARLAALMH